MAIQHLFQHALNEDAPTSDITSDWLLDANTQATAQAVIKSPGIFFASPVLTDCLQAMPNVAIEQCIPDGAPVSPNDIALRLQGGLQDILHIERTLLNFIQRLSGIATITHQFVTALNDPSIQVLDTRKTTPLLRAYEKQAVRAGGGYNHRFGLHDMMLVKENHLKAYKNEWHRLNEKLAQHKKTFPHIQIEVEVASIDLLQVLDVANIDIIMFDNMTISELTHCLAVLNERPAPPLVEVSGNIALSTIGRYRGTGINRISVGSLTHSVTALDVSLLVL
jgi:nicotinate-nucleotide pyrophosphorylase (carboxylating)